ncbi:TIGR03668 family PPOX class F420-dependent oxidoreductase [Nocardioides bizhenqiangii]|uniref:TIGR03668 family PPOX class F420-dependent oxidoreductase n=1 Tax=Nocardioides bizhenqiangii TaxID=3095076 RepID=A0ABZ0ZMK7_9ACTN|nr:MULTISPECIES: TIGR03668 family PPOX class F420-dependent oxidoreductase [unclassified Nocardioides]MDZ5621624.1 TIGR03668 family PPOX class F420-dependent oxidoreductase [Nocardioides sp. HM23]WQQ25540.1 TIGR03668 family PPOX class F420-dependent oxidoreductase [Nocardioides sp. HM61]
MDAAAMRSMVEPARVARLATVSVEGGPHLVPVCFVLVGDTVYSAVDHKPKKTSRLRRIANIKATGRACVLVDEYHDADWTRLRWARLDGRARLVESADEAGRARTALVGKYPQYARTPPSGPLIALDITRWTGWSADEP